MKKTVGMVFLAVVMIACAWGKEKTAASVWTANPINIDGKAYEWGKATPFTEDNAKVEVQFQNDGKNLYIYFVFHDRKKLSTFAQTGMTVWINSEGKKKKKQGFLFQGRQIPAAMMIAYLEQDLKKTLTEEEKNKIMAEKMHVIRQCIYLSKEDTPFPNGHTASPAFIDTAGDTIALEYRIPFNFAEALPEGTAQESLEPGKEVMIGFEWGGMTRTMRGKMMQRQSVTINDGKRYDSIDTLKYEDNSDGMSSRDFTGMNSHVNRGPKVWSFWVQLSIAGQ